MKTLTGFTLTLFFILGMTFQSFATVATPSTVATPKAKKESAFKQLTAEEIFTMPRADIEAKIGRKLKFKERLGLLIIQKAYKKAKKRNPEAASHEPNENLFGIMAISFSSVALFAYWGAFVIGLAGIVLGGVGLSRNEPKRFLSILGIVLGILVILLYLLIAIVFSNW